MTTCLIAEYSFSRNNLHKLYERFGFKRLTLFVNDLAKTKLRIYETIDLKNNLHVWLFKNRES